MKFQAEYIRWNVNCVHCTGGHFKPKKARKNNLQNVISIILTNFSNVSNNFGVLQFKKKIFFHLNSLKTSIFWHIFYSKGPTVHCVLEHLFVSKASCMMNSLFWGQESHISSIILSISNTNRSNKGFNFHVNSVIQLHKYGNILKWLTSYLFLNHWIYTCLTL